MDSLKREVEQKEKKRKLEEERKKSQEEYIECLLRTLPEERRGIYGERLIKNFVSKIDIRTENECWIWLGYCKESGYGSTGYIGERLVHRLMWMIVYGHISSSKYVLHKCDNKLCVNPNHLFLGTPDDNMKDMVRKGRSNKSIPDGIVIKIREDYNSDKRLTCDMIGKKYGISGSQVWYIVNNKRRRSDSYVKTKYRHGGMHKLTWKEVDKIRELWKTGKYSKSKLSRMFNVSNKQISNIVNNASWYDAEYIV